MRGRRGATAFTFWSQSVLSWKYPSDPTWVRLVRRRDAETLCSVSSANVHIGQAVYGVELPSVKEVVHGAERPLGKTPQVPPLPNQVQGEVYREANQTPGSRATSGLHPPWAFSTNLASIRLPLFPFPSTVRVSALTEGCVRDEAHRNSSCFQGHAHA